jgi:flavin-dependent dehydrogenase
MRDTDLFIIGGGPAGLAAAIAARRSGFSVMLADAAIPPIDKACGEGIMPDGLAALAELGVALPEEGTAVFHGIRFLDSENSVEAHFPTGHGVGIRRTVLHPLLVDHAARSGVSMLWGTRVTGISENKVKMDGREASCRWILGADGMNSRTRTWAGLGETPRKKVRYGFRRHYAVEPWSNLVEVHWTSRGQLYITPVSEREICVALVTHERELRVDEAIAACSSIPAAVRQAASSTREQGALSASFRLKSVVHESCALIGEASGSVDSVTGEGMSLAFRQALALEKAMCDGDLSRYEAAHRKVMSLPRMMADLMLFMGRQHGLRRRALTAFSKRPELFSRLLAIHTGNASPFAMGLRATTSLGWHMLTA